LTVQVLKEQNKIDQIPLDLLDRLKRILPFADIVAEEIVCKGTDLLEKVIPRMFEVMYRVAKVSCEYLKRRRWSCFGLASADDHSEDGRRADLLGGDRRNKRRVDQGHRGV